MQGRVLANVDGFSFSSVGGPLYFLYFMGFYAFCALLRRRHVLSLTADETNSDIEFGCLSHRCIELLMMDGMVAG